MSLVEQIDQDLATSMREGVAARTAVLRLVKNSLKNEQIKLGHELGAEEELKVLRREAKQRRDSIQQYQSGGRTDLADSEQHELGIIETYLPVQMGEGELTRLIDAVISETQATANERGMVIGAVMQRSEGRADGGMAARLVSARLR